MDTWYEEMSRTVSVCMGVFRGGGPRGPRPPLNRPQNCRSTTSKDRLAALLLLQCKAHWIRKPDDSTSFSSVNELKEIAEIVVLIDISAECRLFVLCPVCSYSHRVGQKSNSQYSTHNSAKHWPIFKIISTSHSP